jgi:hypothetical protein
MQLGDHFGLTGDYYWAQLIFSAISLCIRALESTGVLDRLKEKLSERKDQLQEISPFTDKAFEELSDILNAIATHYMAIRDELIVFEKSLSFDNEEAIASSKKYLEDVVAGKVRKPLGRARVRCREIFKVWETNKPSLHDWFRTLHEKGHLSNAELEEIEKAFKELSDDDWAYVKSMEEIIAYMEGKANIILDLLASGSIENAKIEANKIRDELAEPRRLLNRELGKLIQKGYGAIEIRDRSSVTEASSTTKKASYLDRLKSMFKTKRWT